jgi:dTDP-4-dehydrorhamnose reductase
MIIIGGTSTIGKSLKRNFAKLDQETYYTIRQLSEEGSTLLHLDLNDLSTLRNIDRNFGTAIVCAGITDTRQCRSKWNKTYQINVVATFELVKSLVKSGNHVIYYSTNMVFDGHKPSCPKYESHSAKTAYGKQKTEIEKMLLGIGDSICIVRLTKVISKELKLFQKWISSLKQGKEIHSFSDWKFAPVSVDIVCSYTQHLANSKATGIYQLSPTEDISYSDSAIRLADYCNFDPALVSISSVNESEFSPEWNPTYTTLKSDIPLEDPNSCLLSTFQDIIDSNSLNCIP